jgi:hypothetical protein
MTRGVRTEAGLLLQEARALELYASEIDVNIPDMQDYWSASTELVALAVDIEAFAGERPDAPADDPEMFALRRRLRTLAARFSQLDAD